MTTLVYSDKGIERPVVETLDICKGAIRLNAPPNLIDLVFDRYRDEKFQPELGKKYIHSLDYHRYILQGFYLAKYIFWLPDLNFYRFEKDRLTIICESEYGVKYADDLFCSRGRDFDDKVIYCDKKALWQLKRFDNNMVIDFEKIDTPQLRHFQTLVATILKEEKTERFPVLTTDAYKKYLDHIWLSDSDDEDDEDSTTPSENLKKAFLKLFKKLRSPY